jgi:hypothetical protein
VLKKSVFVSRAEIITRSQVHSISQYSRENWVVARWDYKRHPSAPPDAVEGLEP